MLAPPLSRATQAADLAPRVLPLEMEPDPMQVFASEHPRVPSAACVTPPPRAAATLPADRRPADPVTRPVAPARGFPLLVTAWLGTGSLAIVAGALSGLAIASLFDARPVILPAGGAVTITSEPPGVPVRIDGLARGVTPFASMLAPGGHRIELGEGPDARTRYVEVRPGGDASLHVAWPSRPATPPRAAAATAMSAPSTPARQPAPVKPAPVKARPVPPPTGSLVVSSPFPVRVLVGGHEIGASTAPRLVVPPGVHAVTLVNERLEFEQVVQVEVAARRTANLTVQPPNGTLHLNAQPWAHVWIDGRRAGDTPIGNLTLPIGEHEVLLRHPDLGEQRRTVTVGARTPVRVGVEFTP